MACSYQKGRLGMLLHSKKALAQIVAGFCKLFLKTSSLTGLQKCCVKRCSYGAGEIALLLQVN